MQIFVASSFNMEQMVDSILDYVMKNKVQAIKDTGRSHYRPQGSLVRVEKSVDDETHKDEVTRNKKPKSNKQAEISFENQTQNSDSAAKKDSPPKRKESRIKYQTHQKRMKTEEQTTDQSIMEEQSVEESTQLVGKHQRMQSRTDRSNNSLLHDRSFVESNSHVQAF